MRHRRMGRKPGCEDRKAELETKLAEQACRKALRRISFFPLSFADSYGMLMLPKIFSQAIL